MHSNFNHAAPKVKTPIRVAKQGRKPSAPTPPNTGPPGTPPTKLPKFIAGPQRLLLVWHDMRVERKRLAEEERQKNLRLEDAERKRRKRLAEEERQESEQLEEKTRKRKWQIEDESRKRHQELEDETRKRRRRLAAEDRKEREQQEAVESLKHKQQADADRKRREYDERRGQIGAVITNHFQAALHQSFKTPNFRANGGQLLNSLNVMAKSAIPASAGQICQGLCNVFNDATGTVSAELGQIARIGTRITEEETKRQRLDQRPRPEFKSALLKRFDHIKSLRSHKLRQARSHFFSGIKALIPAIGVLSLEFAGTAMCALALMPDDELVSIVFSAGLALGIVATFLILAHLMKLAPRSKPFPLPPPVGALELFKYWLHKGCYFFFVHLFDARVALILAMVSLSGIVALSRSEFGQTESAMTSMTALTVLALPALAIIGHEFIFTALNHFKTAADFKSQARDNTLLIQSLQKQMWRHTTNAFEAESAKIDKKLATLHTQRDTLISTAEQKVLTNPLLRLLIDQAAKDLAE